MPYVGSDGRIQPSRPFGLDMIFDFFTGIFGFVNLFFRSMFQLDGNTSRGQYGQPAQRAPRTPGRRMGGIGGGSGPAAPPSCFGGG